MIPFNVSPEILLDILSNYSASVVDEVCYVQKSLILGAFIVEFYERARHEIDVTFFGQILVLLQIRFPVTASLFEFRVMRDPIE